MFILIFVPIIVITIISFLFSKIFKNSGNDKNEKILIGDESFGSYFSRTNKESFASSITFITLSSLFILIFILHTKNTIVSDGSDELALFLVTGPLGVIDAAAILSVIFKTIDIRIRYYILKKKQMVVGQQNIQNVTNI
ncbi:hypothetical protein HXX01_02160 [Candidatus Nomurabacteria bacterium]|nr:hypothetical protein [Candidatus Nomurabacteria bacterium]